MERLHRFVSAARVSLSECFRLFVVHVLMHPITPMAVSIAMWMRRNSAILEIAIGQVCLLAMCAAFVWVRVEGKGANLRPVRVAGILIAAIASVASTLQGVSRMASHVPSAECVVVPRPVQASLYRFVESAKSPRDVHDLLVALRTALGSFHTTNAQLRIELAVYDPEARSLRLASDWFVDGWPTYVVSRSYAIPGYTPGGGSSVAGAAWKERTTKLVPDSSDPQYAGIFCHYGDLADRECGASQCVLSIPVFADDKPTNDPVAVLSVASVTPHELGDPDVQLMNAFVDGLSCYFAKARVSNP